MSPDPRLRPRTAALALVAIAALGVTVVGVGLAVTAPGSVVTAGHHGGDNVAEHSDEHGTSGPRTAVSAADRANAAAIVASTESATAGFADVGAAEAAGYRWIGDGATSGSYRHYVKPEYLLDGLDLDPEHIESLVYRVTAAGTLELVSGMYILAPGTTMDEVPDVAGALTPWHVHTNLCWSGRGIVGTNDSGACPAGSINAVTPPMLHVWVVDNRDGPFAAIDENGIVSAHTHGE